MFKKDDIVVYRSDVCKVKEITHNDITNMDYYILSPLNEQTLTIYAPMNKKEWIRKAISKKEAQALINRIDSIDTIETNEKNYENEYKRLLENDSLEDLVRIIKTTYLRNDNRIQNKKKKSERDENYFNKAEKRLYSELAVSLDMSYEDTKNYIINYLASKTGN